MWDGTGWGPVLAEGQGHLTAKVLPALQGMVQGAAAGVSKVKGFQGQRAHSFIYPTCSYSTDSTICTQANNVFLAKMCPPERHWALCEGFKGKLILQFPQCSKAKPLQQLADCSR